MKAHLDNNEDIVCPKCSGSISMTQLSSGGSHVLRSIPKEGKRSHTSASASGSGKLAQTNFYPEKIKDSKISSSVYGTLGGHQSSSLLQCPTCNKAFNFRSHLLRHVRSHSDAKDFECYRCGKYFKQDYRLKQHWQICNR